MACERGVCECFLCACETLSERLSGTGMQPLCVFVKLPVQLRFHGGQVRDAGEVC